MDPKTLTKYTKEELDKIGDENVRKRVVEISIQSEGVVKERLKRWKDFYAIFEKKSGIRSSDIDGSIGVQKIVEDIIFKLENAI